MTSTVYITQDGNSYTYDLYSDALPDQYKGFRAMVSQDYSGYKCIIGGNAYAGFDYYFQLQVLSSVFFNGFVDGAEFDKILQDVTGLATLEGITDVPQNCAKKYCFGI